MPEIASRAESSTLNGRDVITVEDGEWRDWTSTWRKAGNTSQARHVTMTGTITRGKKRGQSVDVELDLTDQELMQMSQSREILNSSRSAVVSNDAKKLDSCSCGIKSGPQIVFLGIVCFPFVFVISFLVSLYFGLLTWQNIFNYFYDERTICHRILICPVLVLTFPVLIIAFSLGISIYAAFVQLCWAYDNWKAEIGSFEKGFYGWLCSAMSLEFCSPYIVVTLTDTDSPTEVNTPHGSHLSVIEETEMPHSGQHREIDRHFRNERFMPETRHPVRSNRMESSM